MSILHFYTMECPFCLFVYPVKSHSVLLFWSENVLPNTDNAAQLYAQYRQCCSTLCSIPTMLLNSMLNADYAAQVNAQYWQCCSTLCSIPTMMLRSKPNTDYSAQLYAQYWQCCSGLCSIPAMLLHCMLNTHYAAQPCRNCWYYCELEMWFLIFTGTSWGANNISWFCRPTGTGHRVFFPGSCHWNHVKKL